VHSTVGSGVNARSSLLPNAGSTCFSIAHRQLSTVFVDRIRALAGSTCSDQPLRRNSPAASVQAYHGQPDLTVICKAPHFPFWLQIR
jgi:hypothetical protein